jgi:hypothetical protein
MANDTDAGAHVALAVPAEVMGAASVETTSGDNGAAAHPELAMAREVVLQVLPKGAGQLLDQLIVDARGVEMAIQDLMLQIDDLGDQLSQAPRSVSLLGWAVVGAVVTTTLRSAHKRLRKKRNGLRTNGLSNDSLSWMTDLDSSNLSCVN